MLQVALAPAVLAANEVGDGRRGFLARSVQSGGDVDGPAGAAQQGGLDDVMAHDVAAEGLLAGQNGQAGGLGEGLDAQDGVVAPIGALRARPPSQTGGGDAAVQLDAELRDAGEQGGGLDDGRGGLDQADAGVALHGVDHAQDGLAGHGRVGVEHDHELVGGAPATGPVGDVARLGFDVLFAVTIEGLGMGAQAEAGEDGLLRHQGFDLVGVGQDEQVERIRHAQARQTVVDGRQALHRCKGVFVIERHQQGGAGRRRLRMGGEGQVFLLAVGHQDPQADGRVGEPAADRGDQHQEQAEGQHLERVETLARVQDEGGDSRQDGDQQGRAGQNHATAADADGRGGDAGGGGRGIGQGLARHGQRGVFGSPGLSAEIDDLIQGIAAQGQAIHRVSDNPGRPTRGRKMRVRLVHCSMNAFS